MRALTMEEMEYVSGGYGEMPQADGGGGGDVGLSTPGLPDLFNGVILVIAAAQKPANNLAFSPAPNYAAWRKCFVDKVGDDVWSIQELVAVGAGALSGAGYGATWGAAAGPGGALAGAIAGGLVGAAGGALSSTVANMAWAAEFCATGQ